MRRAHDHQPRGHQEKASKEWMVIELLWMGAILRVHSERVMASNVVHAHP